MSEKLQAPNSKVTAGIIGGALASVVLGTVQIFAEVSFPAGYEAGVAVLFTVGVAYMKREMRP